MYAEVLVNSIHFAVETRLYASKKFIFSLSVTSGLNIGATEKINPSGFWGM